MPSLQLCYQIQYSTSKEDHVIKKVHISNFEDVDAWNASVFIHARVTPHPNIVKILGWNLDVSFNSSTGKYEAVMQIVLEKMARTLSDEINHRALEKRPYTAEEIKHFGSQLAEVLLHVEKSKLSQKLETLKHSNC